jgi:5-(carboxyamino)imidazole ribonucleotide synthase
VNTTPPTSTHAIADRHPAILKTTRLGYDGKGQARLKSPADAPPPSPR